MQISIVADGIINENIHNTKDALKERLGIFKSGGINCIDYTVAHKPITCSETWVDMMAEAINESGVCVSQTHGPVVGSFSSENGRCEWQLCDEERKRLKFAFVSANRYGCKNMVIHPHTMWPVWDNKFLKKCRSVNIEFFKMALEWAYKYDVDICLENMITTEKLYGYCANPVELKELHDLLNNKKIKYCVDTGHANYSGYATDDVIEILGEDVKVLHIQDNFGNNDGHCMPPFGNIDWQKTAKALARINYSGNINFEINGERMYGLDDDAKIAYLHFAGDMGRYIERLIIRYKRDIK